MSFGPSNVVMNSGALCKCALANTIGKLASQIICLYLIVNVDDLAYENIFTSHNKYIVSVTVYWPMHIYIKHQSSIQY